MYMYIPCNKLLKVPPFVKIHRKWVSHCVAGDPAPEGTAEGAGETGGYASDGVLKRERGMSLSISLEAAGAQIKSFPCTHGLLLNVHVDDVLYNTFLHGSS